MFSPCPAQRPSSASSLWLHLPGCPEPQPAGAGPTLQISSETGLAVLRQHTALGHKPTLPPHFILPGLNSCGSPTPPSRRGVVFLTPWAPSGPSSSSRPAGVGKETAPPPPHPPLCLCPKAAGWPDVRPWEGTVRWSQTWSFRAQAPHRGRHSKSR